MTFNGIIYLIGYILALLAFEHRFIRLSWKKHPIRWIPAVASLVFGLHLAIMVINGYKIATSGAFTMFAFGVWLAVGSYGNAEWWRKLWRE